MENQTPSIPVLKGPSDRPEPIIKSSDISGVLLIISFLGFTPFCFFGIHDRMMGYRNRTTTHIILFVAAISVSLFYSIFTTAGLINDNSYTQQLSEYAMIAPLIISYIMSIIHTIGYRRFIQENPHLFIDSELKARAEGKEDDDGDDEDEDEEEEDNEDNDEDDEPFSPEPTLKL